jgi:predicted transport protein
MSHLRIAMRYDNITAKATICRDVFASCISCWCSSDHIDGSGAEGNKDECESTDVH